MSEMLSIVIPACNEEKRIKATLEKLLRFLNKARLKSEVIVVNNGEDDTWRVVKEFVERDSRVRLIDFRKPLGKGRALKEGFKAAHGDVLTFDADASMPPKEIPKLLKALKDCDVVIASRRLPESSVSGIPPHRKTASATFALLVKLVGGLPYSDTQCGFKLFRRSALKKMLSLMRESGFAWDVEMLYLARRLKLKVREVPVEWSYASGGSVSPGAAAKMVLDLLILRARFG
jgi:dolichyl-phosphate beta-glucosyltransferase